MAEPLHTEIVILKLITCLTFHVLNCRQEQMQVWTRSYTTKQLHLQFGCKTIWIIVESNLTWQTLWEVIHTRDQTLSSQSNAGVTSWDLWGSTDNNNTLCTPSCHMDVVDRTILSKFWHKVCQNLPRTSLNKGQISREWHCTREHQAVKLNKHWYIKTHHCSS